MKTITINDNNSCYNDNADGKTDTVYYIPTENGGNDCWVNKSEQQIK